MGIRTSCPNGHKLHLKAFLAGKRGICPKCGAKFVIPLADGTAPAPVARPGTKRPTSEGGLFDQPIDRLIDGHAHDAEPPIEIGTEPGLVGDHDLEATQPIGPPAVDLAPAHVPQPPKASASAVFAEQPEAVWYVQLVSGERFGPAIGSMMQAWLEQGRIPSDALVWRQGWPDWRLAKEAFRGGAGSPPATGADKPISAELVAPLVAARPGASAGAVRARARTRLERRMNSVVALVVVVAVLAVVLAVVLLRQ